ELVFAPPLTAPLTAARLCPKAATDSSNSSPTDLMGITLSNPAYHAGYCFGAGAFFTGEGVAAGGLGVDAAGGVPAAGALAAGAFEAGAEDVVPGEFAS